MQEKNDSENNKKECYILFKMSTNYGPLALTIDFGTQSLRASLVDKKGNIVAIAKHVYQPVYYSKQKGYAEQDPDYYYRCAIEALKELSSKHKNLLSAVVGATITTFRDTAVLLDENNVPVRDLILWLDQRTAEAKEKLPLLHRFLFWLVGMKDTVELNRKRTMAHWYKENEPKNWAKTKKYVNISSYLTYKFTGKLVDSSASMTGHYPINYRKKKWYKGNELKARIFGIPHSLLCDLVDPGQPIGTILDSIAEECGLPLGIMIYASGTDKGCEIVGLGALSKNIAAVSYGTASTVEVSNRKYHEPETFLPAYGSAIPGWYNMEVQIYRGYWMLGWFSKEFASSEINEAKIQKMAVEEVLNKKLGEIPPGCDGLVLQPYWGAGLKRPLAKGSIVGFSDVHTREHLYRAIIEGIAYALREGLEGIEKSQKHKVSQIMISGGGSQSTAICQITADIFGLPVSKIQTFEATTLGAAIAVFLATKQFDDYEQAKQAMVHVSTTFVPNKNHQEQYDYLYKKVYLKMYPQFKDVYRDLKKFDKKY